LTLIIIIIIISGAQLRRNSGALCLAGTTPIHPELGCETDRGKEKLVGELTGNSFLVPG
jgi:hypothetical protein